MIDYKVNHLDKRAVSTVYFWRAAHTCPLHVMVLLLSDDGTATIGSYQPGAPFTHWAPLPKRPPVEDV